MRGGNEGATATKYLGWRILSGAVVVILALVAVVLSLLIVLDHYAVDLADGEAVGASASSVVAVLTPVVAGIVGVAGLFFGISATGSKRGREAESQSLVAETNAKTAAEALPEVVKATNRAAAAAEAAGASRP